MATATKNEAPERTSILNADDPMLGELERLMRDFESAYRSMLGLVRRRHEAMRKARPSELAGCLEEESGVIRRIADLEKDRLRVVGDLAQRLGSDQRMYTRMSWIASFAPEPVKTRLVGLSDALRQLIEAVHHENKTVGVAARALAAHMDGLMRQVAARLNHAHVYGRTGLVEAGPRVVSSLYVRS